MLHSSKGNGASLLNELPSFCDEYDSRLQAELDVLVRGLHDKARLLFALTSKNGLRERRRLLSGVMRGVMVEPCSEVERQRVEPRFWAALRRARLLSETCVAPELYQARLTELETELCMLESLGNPKQIRSMAARRYGTGAMPVDDARPTYRLSDLAGAILHSIDRDDEAASVPSHAEEGLSLERLAYALARSVGLTIDVRVEPRLTANAAAGDRTVFIADRTFGNREAVRMAVHEVLGHLVAAFNGRAQPLGIFALGTAGSFTDQEGLAIYLEEAAGVLDGTRLRTLAARVIVTDAMHDGARFGEVARDLIREHGFTAEEAIALTERAFRGGGIARDTVYLRGWMRVRHAIAEERAELTELWAGKLGLRDLQTTRGLRSQGYFRPGFCIPNLSQSLCATGTGTSFDTSPPSLVTSLTRLEAT